MGPNFAVAALLHLLQYRALTSCCSGADAHDVPCCGVIDDRRILSVSARPQVSPYLNNVILSPHIYPPSVTNAPSNYSGAGLNYRLSRSFGSKMKEASMPWRRRTMMLCIQNKTCLCSASGLDCLKAAVANTCCALGQASCNSAYC